MHQPARACSGSDPIVLSLGSWTLKLMSSTKTNISVLTCLVVSGVLAGCASDKAPPAYHTVISYDPTRAQTFLANVPPTNAPSTRDWKTNDVVGVGYGSTGPNVGPPAPTAVGGAVSTPSGMSSGAGSGTSSAAPSAPGTIIGNPPGAGSIGTYPNAPTAPGPINTSPAITPPQTPNGINSGINSTTPFRPSTSLLYPGNATQTGLGFTNASSGVLFTNRYTAPTNPLSSPGLNVPRP